MRASLFFLLVLAGCGSGGQPNDNHGYGFAYDVQGPTGLKLRYSPVVSSGDFADPAFYEGIQTRVETCAGLRAPGPFIVLVKDLGPNNGLYWTDPSLIVISDLRIVTVKHEMIHYLLDVNTGDQDHNHLSHLFTDCI